MYYTYKLVIDNEVIDCSNNLTYLRQQHGNDPRIKIYVNGKENKRATKEYFSKYRMGY